MKTKLTVLRKYREDRQMSQAQLGQEFGVAAETIYRWESGNRKIDPDLLPLVSEKTGIPREQLRPDLVNLLGASQ